MKTASFRFVFVVASLGLASVVLALGQRTTSAAQDEYQSALLGCSLAEVIDQLGVPERIGVVGGDDPLILVSYDPKSNLNWRPTLKLYGDCNGLGRPRLRRSRDPHSHS